MSSIIENIVNNNLCIGCGLCAGVCPQGLLTMDFNIYGEYNPVLKQACSKEGSLCMSVCPFNDKNMNETEIGREIFGHIEGINYSLDYGIPRLFTGLDDIVLRRKKTLIVWGASISPFDKNQNYERYVLNHLKNITTTFERESATVKYLEKNNIYKNVIKTVDPAFLMDPVNPIKKNREIVIDKGSIGINLSPLIAKYVTNGDMEIWKKVAAKIISLIAARTLRTIYLVPHVDILNSSDNLFLNEVLEEIDDNKNRILIKPKYNAAETKWIISQMYLFAGDRTHSTIAALSSRVPTLSFAYSIKAKGINNDIFGNDFYCLDPSYITPEIGVEKIEYILANYFTIKSNLMVTIERMKVGTLLSGKVLIDVRG